MSVRRHRDYMSLGESGLSATEETSIGFLRKILARFRKTGRIAFVSVSLYCLLFISYMIFELFFLTPFPSWLHFSLNKITEASTWLLKGSGAVLLAATIGIPVYWFRQRHRAKYGIIEVIIGGIGGGIALMMLFAPSELDKKHINLETSMFTNYLLLATSLYVVVSGLDNIAKGLKTDDLKTYWRDVFGDL